MSEIRQHFFSRSARDTDDTCPRRRYWETQWGGRGLSPVTEQRELLFGTVLHYMLAHMWWGASHGDIVEGVQQQAEWGKLGQSDQWLVRCLFYAYYRQVYPRYLAEWDVLYVEEELRVSRLFPEDFLELILLCQPDVMLRHKESGRTRYIEYKSTKLLTANYIESWRYSPQLAAGAVAALETHDLIVDECVMAFFDKGSESHNGEWWNSPFTNYWRREREGAHGQVITEYSPKRPQAWKGWERFEPWAPGGPTGSDQPTPEEWVEWVTEQDLSLILGQLPESMPVQVDPLLVASWLEASFERELAIAQSWGGPPTTKVHPHRFRQCRPVIGRICSALSLCWNQGTAADPLGSGLYQLRVPHHRAEREALGLEPPMSGDSGGEEPC